VGAATIWSFLRGRGTTEGLPGLAPLLVACLAIAPADEAGVFADVEGLDPVALEASLRARVGDELDRWSITVIRESPTQVRVELSPIAGSHAKSITRSLTLEGDDDEDRSRELASTLALLLDELGDDDLGSSSPAPDPAATPSGERPDGFVALEGRVELGPPRDPAMSLGLGLGGGVWLLDDHLQPRARVGWSHAWASGPNGLIELHQFHVGGGLAGGAAFGRLWFGALVLPTVKWTYARQHSSSSAWFGGGELSALAQYRRERLVIGLRTGIETTFPAARARGTQDTLRWGHLRWLCVFEIGLGI
jgi:hypothetical protein